MVGATSSPGGNIIHQLAISDPVPWYRKPNLRALYLLLFPCVIGIEMTSGFDAQIINAVQLVPAWTDYFGKPTGGYKGILASSLPLGSVLGLPFIPFVNDGIGRRWCILFGSSLMIFGSVLQGLSKNPPMYIIARVIIGFGLPYSIVAGSCLIGELGYPKERPILTSLFNACFFIGSITAAAITFGTQKLTSDWSWRIPSLLQMAPSVLQVSLVLFLPESPRYLVSKDRHEEALQILTKYHAEGDESSEFVKAEMMEIKTTIALELENSKRSWLDMVRTPAMRRRVLVASWLGLCTQLSGNLVISYYLTDALKLIGYTDSAFQAKYNIGNNCTGLVTAVLASLFVMKFRRRTMYLTAIVIIFSVYLSWTICSARFAIAHDLVAAKFSLFWIYAYNIGYNIGFNALTYTFLVELFPFSTRARGISIFQLFGKLAQFFGTNVNPLGMENIGWKYLMVYCCWIFVEGTVIYFLWPETSGKSLEELAFLFEGEEMASKVGKAVEGAMHEVDGDEKGNATTREAV